MRKTVYGIAFAGFGISLLMIASGWNPFVNSEVKKSLAEVTSVKEHTSETLTDNALDQATLLLQLGDLEGALALIHQNENQLNDESVINKKWVDLFIEVSGRLQDYPQLVLLHRHFPEAFVDNEQASLLLADAFISSHDNESFQILRSNWKNHETRHQEWMLLDVDALLLNHQQNEAIQLLQSKTFLGSEESGRLVRLALLNIVDNPKAAWDYLAEASIRDPHNPDIHTYRARLLESVGKKALAQVEYIASVKTDPDNIFLKDQLADFYLRNGQYQSAMSVWLETLDGPTLDSILLKVLFWSRVISPVEYNWKALIPPSGKLQALNRYLMRLEPGQFWDESHFTQIQGGANLLAAQQATFWLRLFDFLQNGKEDQALNLLETASFGSDSWDASLEHALTQLIVYRKTGLTANSKDSSNPARKTGFYETNEEPFFVALKSLIEKEPLQPEERRDSISSDLQVLLKSPEVFTVALISAGWLEAGLQLHREQILPKEMPPWVAVTVAEAVLENRGHEAALKYVMMQPVTPELSQITLGLLKETRNNDSALNELKRIAKNPSEEGMKASWMASMIYIERGDYANARKVIEANSSFAETLLGRESLARIALYEGNVEAADVLYFSIVEDSSEAKSYLALKAFNEKEWEKARLFTQELLQLYPENALLQENLRKIQALESHK